jgi:hypothetical protein
VTGLYTVKCDTPTEQRSGVLNCGMLPGYGSMFVEDAQCFAVKIEADQDKDNPWLWHVTIEWKTLSAGGRSPGDQQLQPDQRRPKWSARFVTVPEARYVDLQGQPLQDAAGSPFDPPPDIPIVCDEITIVRYESACNRLAQRAYMQACNSGSWNGAEQGTALVQDINVQEDFVFGAYWFLTTYNILVKPRIMLTIPHGGTLPCGGWDPEYTLNVGPKCLVQSGSNYVLSQPKVDGYADGRPVFLAADGTQLVRDTSGQYTNHMTYLTFHTKNQVAFGPLGLIPPPGWFGA